VAAATCGREKTRKKLLFFRPFGEEVLANCEAGYGVVSEPFTYKHNVKRGDTITLRLELRLQDFRIAM